MSSIVINPDDRDLKYVALTVYGEARGESCRGKIAVAHVIRNRSKYRNMSLYDVVMQPYQFSCWNEDDPNREVLEKILSNWEHHKQHNSALRECLWLSAGVILGMLSDPTDGADHYVTKRLVASGRAPEWTKKFFVSAIIDRHIFYNSRKGRTYG